MIPVAAIGFILAPHLPVMNIISNFDSIDWTDIRYTEDTLGFISVCEVIYLCIYLSTMESGHYRHGEEYGSAKIVSPQSVRRLAAQENKEYKKAFSSKELKHRLQYRNSMDLPLSKNPIVNIYLKIRVIILNHQIEKIEKENLELIKVPTLKEYIKERKLQKKQRIPDDKQL